MTATDALTLRDDASVAGIVRFGDHELDLDRFELRSGAGPVPVEPQVFDVLAFLVEHRDRVVTKEELLDEVWGDRFVSESALTSRIKAARRAVGDTGRAQRVIRTVHGRGYRFVAELDGEDTAPAEPSPTPVRQAVHTIPRTRYARSGDLSIAYQVVGDGPGDLVFIPGFVSNIELHWEHPDFIRFFSRLADIGRLITFDKRGTGLSERVPSAQLPTLEERIDDVRAVLDAAGSDRADLFGISEGSAMAVLFAATHPDRVARLVLFGAYGWTPRLNTANAAMVEDARAAWGTGAVFEFLAPSTAGDKETRRFFSRLERHSASPDVAAGLVARSNEIDVSDILPSVQAPTLVLHRSGDSVDDGDGGRQGEHRCRSQGGGPSRCRKWVTRSASTIRRVSVNSCRSLPGLLSRMRCWAKKRWMRGARRSEYREYSQAEQRSRRAFWAATRRDGASWAHFGVARPRHTDGMPSGSRLELRPTRRRRMRDSKPDRLLGSGRCSNLRSAFCSTPRSGSSPTPFCCASPCSGCVRRFGIRWGRPSWRSPIGP